MDLSDDSDEDTDEDGDDYDYSEYSDEVEEDMQNNDAEYGTGNELVAASHEHDAMSVASSAIGRQGEPENLLQYGIPSDDEDDTGLTTEDESEWEPPAVRKRKVVFDS